MCAIPVTGSLRFGQPPRLLSLHCLESVPRTQSRGARGGSSRKPWWPDSGQELSAPAVNLVTGKCKTGRVSRTVSSSLLTLDMTVVCTPDPDRLQPEVRSQKVLPADTVNESVTGFDTSTPLIATPAMLVGQKTLQVEEFPTLDLSESSELLPSFGLSTSSSSSSSPTLPWGTADDSSPSFSPNQVREGQSQSKPDEGSLFNVSCVLLGTAERPSRRGYYCPRCWMTSMIRLWVIRYLMPELTSFRGRNPHFHCLCTHGHRDRHS